MVAAANCAKRRNFVLMQIPKAYLHPTVQFSAALF